MKRFTKHELFQVRNSIDIKFIIEKVLNLPAKIDGGNYRFLCPKCSEFLASVNTTCNLSRCFRCKQNVNNIELIMEEKGISFVNSVKALQKILSSNSIF